MDRTDRIKTTVIVPMYNTQAFIADCLDSLRRQQHTGMQVIVVDDGSTDAGMQVVEAYAACFEELLVIRQSNSGSAAARNVGLRAAKGQFIYFLDSDDLIEDDTLETCYQCAVEHDLDVVLFDAKVFLDDDMQRPEQSRMYQIGAYDRRGIIKDVGCRYTGRSFLEKYMTKDPDVISVCLMYTRRTFIEKHQLLFQEGIMHEDEEYRFRFMMADPVLMYLPRLFYHRRYRLGSIMTASVERKRFMDYLSALEQMIASADKDDRLAMEYIARKIWPVYGRFDHLQGDGGSWRRKKKLCRLLQDYFCKFYSMIDEDSRILFEYQIAQLAGPESVKGYEDIASKRNSVLHDILSGLPFQTDGQLVGIYGVGPHTSKLLEEYQACVGKIRAELVFIDSSKKTGTESCRGSRIYNVADIGGLPVREIVISSYLYERDMVDRIRDLYGSRYRLDRLYEEHPFVLLYMMER